jgi:hypothetical protein
MKTTIQYPVTEYPYLAVFTSGESLSKEDLFNIKREDIVLISIVYSDKTSDGKPYVQYLLGGKPSYFTEEENAYTPLPKGTEINIIQ